MGLQTARTVLAFVLGAALVSATWVLAGPTRPTTAMSRPAAEGPAPEEGLGEPVIDFGWRGSGGEAARLSDLLGQGPVVVAVRDLSWPVSQRYGVTLRGLEDEFAEAGVDFLYVDLTPAEVEWSLGMTRDQAELRGTHVRGVGEEFFAGLHPRTTTEVFLIDGSGVLRYRGAIDDQFGVDFARQAPDQRFLADAIEATLEGESPEVPSTFAPGSYLATYIGQDAAPTPEGPPVVTYARDIRPLLETNCVSCHSPGGSGPFTLDGYDAVVANQEEIRSMVAGDRMPPWPANPEYGRWANDQRLNALEKEQLRRWFDAGMPRGDAPPQVPSTPLPASDHGWRNGSPDAVLSTEGLLPLSSDEEPSLETFYIRTDFGEDLWVGGMEILPSALDAVVQAVVLLESPDTPEEDRSQGLEGFFAGYAPGYDGGVFPKGMAKRLPKGSWLKLQVHYRPQASATDAPIRIGLTFASAPSSGELETRSAFATGFEIPAHASHHAVTAEHHFPVGGEIHSFSPQMHLRGSAIRYVLVDPRGNERTVLDIPRYYFQFRMRSVAEEPIPVEAGSPLTVTGWYDNSEANVANPDPSAPAEFGSELTDELMIGYFDFVADQPPAAALTAPEERDR